MFKNLDIFRLCHACLRMCEPRGELWGNNKQGHRRFPATLCSSEFLATPRNYVSGYIRIPLSPPFFDPETPDLVTTDCRTVDGVGQRGLRAIIVYRACAELREFADCKPVGLDGSGLSLACIVRM
jgi:hypothetical protein